MFSAWWHRFIIRDSLEYSKNKIYSKGPLRNIRGKIYENAFTYNYIMEIIINFARSNELSLYIHRIDIHTALYKLTYKSSCQQFATFKFKFLRGPSWIYVYINIC